MENDKMNMTKSPAVIYQAEKEILYSNGRYVFVNIC